MYDKNNFFILTYNSSLQAAEYMKKTGIGKERIVYLILIMAVVSVLVTGIAIGALYVTAFDEEKQRLTEIAKSQARLIEAIAKFNQRYNSKNHPEGSFGATLTQLIEAMKKSGGFGETGEFCLAELEGKKIIFLIRHRHDTKLVRDDENIHRHMNMGDSTGEPIQAALQSRSGSMIGLDYQGKRVLAAFEPVNWPGRTIGIVAKIDLHQIRKPFIKSGIIASLATFIAVFLGAILFKRISNPLILQLEESEVKFRNIVEKSPVATVITDDAGNIDHFNRKFIDLFGWTTDDILTPEQWWASVYPDENYRKEVQATWKIAIEKTHTTGDEIEPQQWLMKCKNGNSRYVELRMIRIWENTNIITLHDMTEIKETEEALRKSERNIRSVFENMQDTYYRTDMEGRISMVSPSVWNLIAYDPQEIIGKQLADFYIDPGKRTEFLTALKEAGGAIHGYEAAVKRKDGKEIWVSTNAHYYMDESGRISGVEGSVRNITKRRNTEDELKKAYYELDRRVEARTAELSEANRQLLKEVTHRKKIESALRQSENRLNNVLIHIKDIIWSVSPTDNKLLYISPAAESIYGRKISDFHDNNNLWLEAVHPEDLPMVKKSNQIIAEKGYKELVYRIIQPGGNIRWIEDRAWLFKDDVESQPVIHGITSDITDKKIAENEAKLHHQQLIRADKMKSLGVLVSGVAHEINNPNNFILLNSQTLEDLLPPLLDGLTKFGKAEGENLSEFMSNEELLKEVPDLLKGIGESSQRIKRIVRKLKDFSTQGSPDYFQDVIINDVVDSAVIIASSLIRSSTNHFKIDYGYNLPIIKGYGQELEQVIINLITNACHALPTKDKGIHISTIHNEINHAVEIKVSDEGIGIPDNIMANIMEPFFTTKRDSGGTGLGLSVSFTIMQNHRGELKFTSEPGKGTEATMRLFTDSKYMLERRKDDP